jgi:hypothetical protein
MKTAIRGIAVVVALFLSATAAVAAPITATLTLTATSGTIGATPLGGVDITIVGVGDTNANTQFFPGVFGEPATVTITIPGVGVATATVPPLLIYGEPGAGFAGFGASSTNVFSIGDPTLFGYQALTNIGPITSALVSLGPPISTTLGTLTVLTARSGTFRAVITPAPVPMLPPEGLIALTLLLAAAAVWQLRRRG